MSGIPPLVAFIDIDDTLVRSFGSKRIPMTELGLEDCFIAFLPKPNVMIDDQAVSEWRRFLHVHPGRASSMTVREYEVAALGEPR